MLLAAQQPLPSRALKAKPVRRWWPEERREGFLGLYRSRGNRTGHGRWGYPPSRAGRPAKLPLPPQGCAHSPPSGSGVLFRRGPGPCSTPGSGPRTARRGGPGRSGGCPTAAGDLPRSGNPSGAPAGLPQGEPCENGWCDIPGLVQVLYTWSSPRVSAFGEGRGAVVTIVANALHPREGYRLTGGDRPGTPPRECPHPAGVILGLGPAALPAPCAFESSWEGKRIPLLSHVSDYRGNLPSRRLCV